MQPLSLPSSLFIFKGLKSVGFWMSDWYKQHGNSSERKQMTEELVRLMEEGKLKAPDAQIIELTGTDEEIGQKAREAIKSVKGRKVIFTFPDDN